MNKTGCTWRRWQENRPLPGRRRTRVVDSKTVDFLELVNDSNILTVLSMLRDSGSVEQLKLLGGIFLVDFKPL